MYLISNRNKPLLGSTAVKMFLVVGHQAFHTKIRDFGSSLQKLCKSFRFLVSADLARPLNDLNVLLL